MAGQNRYRLLVTKSLGGYPLGQTCVFVSHRRSDTQAALAVATYLVNLDFDIYIDEEDELLAAAMQAKNQELVVSYIEAGINLSTHLLGIISENTKGSWWVPFEIGSARRKGLHIAYMLLDNVDFLPEYLTIAKRINDVIDLRTWVHSELGLEYNQFMKSALSWSIPGLPGQRANPPRFVEQA